jgi:hypothetical protein
MDGIDDSLGLLQGNTTQRKVRGEKSLLRKFSALEKCVTRRLTVTSYRVSAKKYIYIYIHDNPNCLAEEINLKDKVTRDIL